MLFDVINTFLGFLTRLDGKMDQFVTK